MHVVALFKDLTGSAHPSGGGNPYLATPLKGSIPSMVMGTGSLLVSVVMGYEGHMGIVANSFGLLQCAWECQESASSHAPFSSCIEDSVEASWCRMSDLNSS